MAVEGSDEASIEQSSEGWTWFRPRLKCPLQETASRERRCVVKPRESQQINDCQTGLKIGSSRQLGSSSRTRRRCVLTLGHGGVEGLKGITYLDMKTTSGTVPRAAEWSAAGKKVVEI